MNVSRNNSNALKIDKMPADLKAAYLATGRVTVGHIDNVVKNEEGKNVFKRKYVAKIRGVIVGNTGEYEHETPEAAKKYGKEILAKWQDDFLKGKKE